MQCFHTSKVEQALPDVLLIEAERDKRSAKNTTSETQAHAMKARFAFIASAELKFGFFTKNDTFNL